MHTYSYKVRNKTGEIVSGEMSASDAGDLRKKLDALGFFIIEYCEVKPKSKFFLSQFIPGFKDTNLNDMSIFSWQLYTMLNAGLTLLNALDIIERQTANEKLQGALIDIQKKVKEGISFSDSLKEHPRIFSKLFVHMVCAGEIGGVLDEMLKRLAIFYESQAQIRERVKLALTYPAILLFVSIGVIVFLVTYVLPQFAFVFEDMGATIPLPTQMLLDLSVYITSYWVSILSIIIAIAIGVKINFATDSGRYMVDKAKLHCPVIGDLVKKITAARFTQTLSILVAGGIPILTALDVVIDTVGNSYVTKALRDMTVKVGEGKSIATPLEESNIFPEMVVNLIRVGEETGALDEMLDKISQFYNREVDNAIQTFTKLIEPFLIVLMTGAIGFIAISIFMPMADIMQGFHA